MEEQRYLNTIIEINFGEDTVPVFETISKYAEGLSISQMVEMLPGYKASDIQQTIRILMKQGILYEHEHPTSKEEIYFIDLSMIRLRAYSAQLISITNKFDPLGQASALLQLFIHDGLLTYQTAFEKFVEEERIKKSEPDPQQRKVTFERIFERMKTVGYIGIYSIPKFEPKKTKQQKDEAKRNARNGIKNTKKNNQSNNNNIITNNALDNNSNNNNSVSSLIYYSINFDRFIMDLKMEIIIEFHSRLVDSFTLQILSVMLMFGSHLNDKSFTPGKLVSLLPQREIKNSNDTNRIINSLHCLTEMPSRIVSRGSGVDEFKLNVSNALESIRMSSMQNLILSKFGDIESRIFRYLYEQKQDSELVITEKIIASKKEVRSALHNLRADGWILVGEASGSSNSASETSNNLQKQFIYSFNFSGVNSKMLNDLYFGWSNGRMKIANERKKVQDVIDKINAGDSSVVTPDEQSRYDKYDRGSERMQAILQGINLDILLFQHAVFAPKIENKGDDEMQIDLE